MHSKRSLIIVILGLLFIVGVAGGYLYFSKVSSKKMHADQKDDTIPAKEELFTVRIYYPVGYKLQIEERVLKRKTSQIENAQAIVEEFLKGPAGIEISHMPKDVKPLGVYKDPERIIYVELSEEFRRNFHGDVLTEYLLLKGLYESLTSNLDGIEDVKVLIEGRDLETLGGHFYLSYPLKGTVSKYESSE